MNKPMTAQEFVENSGRCPKCHSENVSWDEISVEGDSTFQEASCQDCDARFYTISRLVGFGLYEGDTADCETSTVDAEGPDAGRPGGEWMEVFMEMLQIVEGEYETDSEPEDLERWKNLIDRAHRLLGVEPQEEGKES